jgi:hypothetical protein
MMAVIISLLCYGMASGAYPVVLSLGLKKPIAAQAMLYNLTVNASRNVGFVAPV